MPWSHFHLSQFEIRQDFLVLGRYRMLTIFLTPQKINKFKQASKDNIALLFSFKRKLKTALLFFQRWILRA